MKPHAIVCLSQAFHIRNIVYSEFFAALKAKYDVTLLVPEGFAPPPEARDLVAGCARDTVHFTPHPREGLFLFLRKNVFAGRDRTQSFNLITEQERAAKPRLYAVAGAVNAVVGRLPGVGRLWRWIEGRLVPGREFDRLFRGRDVDVVITANYGTEPVESRLIRAAARAGVPTVALVPSWDNLSSKGVIGAMPDHLVVWNETMRQEALSLYDFRQDQIHICGALQFDHHLQAAKAPPAPIPYPVPEGAPLLVYATITPKYFRYNIEVVEQLLAQVANGGLPRDTHIVVRLHPQVLYDPVFGDDLDGYRRLEADNPHVHLSVPDVSTWGPVKAPTFADFNELISLLRRADAILAPASTVAIDAAAVDTPMIGLGFDGAHTLPYERSVRRTFDFTHYVSLMRHGAVELADTPAAVSELFAAYRSDPARKSAARRAVVEHILTFPDGHAARRAMSAIDRLRAHRTSAG